VLVAVQALPDRQRDAIVLRELEGRSYEEIARALGVSDGAVRQLLNRARNSLRAAAAAITPMPLLTRLASAESAEPVSARVAEMVGVGAAGSGALVAKVCATALVTGAVVGGVAVAPDNGRDERRGTAVGAEPAQAAENRPGDADSGDAVPSQSGSDRDRAGSTAEGGQSGRRGGNDERAAAPDDERSGRRGGDEDDGGGADDDNSGPGGGDNSGPGEGGEPEPDEDHSGPGGGGDELEPELEEALSEDNSGPGGGGGSGSSGSGSGDPLDLPEPEEPDNSGPG
jgi:hypothetical protein